jgi:hypothetical protein
MPECPQCGASRLEIIEYDFGVCRETGYHDAGERFTCRACGATGDVEEIEKNFR